MPVVLFVAFILVPLVELWVILQVGGVIGAAPTIVLLVVDSLVGAWLVRREGRRAWDALRGALSSGQWPADEMTQGALVIFGGALLLTPGFVTDVVGLLSVLPPTRAMMSSLLRRWTTTVAGRRMGAGGADGPTTFRRTGGARTGRGTGDRSSGRAAGRRRPANDPAARAPDDPDVEVLGVERDEPRD